MRSDIEAGDDGEFEYTSDSEDFVETAEPVRNAEHQVTVGCAHGHEWNTAMTQEGGDSYPRALPLKLAAWAVVYTGRWRLGSPRGWSFRPCGGGQRPHACAHADGRPIAPNPNEIASGAGRPICIHVP